MAGYQEVFKRYEKKYLLNENQYHMLKKRLEDRMTVDQYGLHTICNIYYDTPDFQLIQSSLEKPDYKEKLRVRSYGVPNEETMVFVEIKKKFDGVVYKRRVSMKLKEANRYLATGKHAGKNSQITNEIDWVLNRYGLAPAVYIAYDRLALFGKEDPNVRVTFDRNIRFREEKLDLSQGSIGTPVIDPGLILMEVKIPGVMPLWMSKMFSELEIFPTSFSKYGMCYKKFLSKFSMKKGGQHCA